MPYYRLGIISRAIRHSTTCVEANNQSEAFDTLIASPHLEWEEDAADTDDQFTVEEVELEEGDPVLMNGKLVIYEETKSADLPSDSTA